MSDKLTEQQLDWTARFTGVARVVLNGLEVVAGEVAGAGGELAAAHAAPAPRAAGVDHAARTPAANVAAANHARGPATPNVASPAGKAGGAKEVVASEAKTTISISPDRATIDPTGNQLFTATADDPDGTSRLLADAEWASDEPLVMVDAHGLATAMRAAGAAKTILATITVTDPQSGARGTAQLLVEPAQPAPMSKRQEDAAMAAYYESERQSAADAAASFREGVADMSTADIDSRWDAEKEQFVAVASSPANALKRDQLLLIYRRYWGDRYTALNMSHVPPNDHAAVEQEWKEWKQAESMLASVVDANEILLAAADAGKHLTLDQLNKATAEIVRGQQGWVELGQALGGGADTGLEEPTAVEAEEPVGPTVEPEEPVTGGGGDATEPPAGNGGGGPARPPAETVKASPPPPPQQTSRPGAPRPVTDTEVVKTNVDAPATIKVQSPGPHQTDWTARGGTGKAPAAYRDGDGNVHVSTDHPLMGNPKGGGIPPVRAGDGAPPGRTPPRAQPAPGPTPTKSGGDIGLEDTGKAPAPANPPVDPGAKTPPAQPRDAPVPKDAPTGAAAAESQRGQAPRQAPRQAPPARFDPPQAVSRDVVETIRGRPRIVDPNRKGSGSNVNYTIDHDAHELAWKRLGGHGDSPPAFIHENQVYLDPSRWKD